MLIIPVVSLLLLGGRLHAAQGGVTLKYVPPIGKTFQYRMTMSMKSDGAGGTPDMGFTTAVDIDTKALSRDGDVTTIETKMGQAKVTIPDDSPLASMKDTMEQQMSGKTSQTKINSRFEVQSLTGAGAPSAETLNSMASALQNFRFPDHSVKVGDSWTANLDMGKLLGAIAPGQGASGTSGKIPMTFSLKSVEDKAGVSVATVHITMKGDVTMSPSGQEMTMHLDGSGDMLVNVADGTLVSTSMVSKSTIDVGTMTMVQRP